MHACPSEASIEWFLRGAGGDTSRAALAAHADRCDECLELLAALAPDASVAPRELEPGDRIGRYTVLRSVGRGAMGEVFAAHDRELDRSVAIKVWTHDSPTRLLVEARGLARVRDPHVVALHDVGSDGGRVFAVMELVEGWTLGQWIALHRRGWREVLDVLRQAGRGLAAVHAERLVHRDVKPDNVLVGDDGRVRIVDFGLARLVADTSDASPPRSPTQPVHRFGSPRLSWPSRLTLTGAVIGTPAYMAPEQLRREPIDARADQYSFCVMLWEALAGARPFPAKSLPELMEALRTRPPRAPERADVPPAIWATLRRGLAYEPSARFPDMTSLLAALAA
ncbi:MAG TPA: serine/threonine-protein kinase, partial [Nannocystaceae bacterium]|nr:serine/threonine-protein kinase [Nannocystaceae bacterium]